MNNLIKRRLRQVLKPRVHGSWQSGNSNHCIASRELGAMANLGDWGFWWCQRADPRQDPARSGDRARRARPKAAGPQDHRQPSAPLGPMLLPLARVLGLKRMQLRLQSCGLGECTDRIHRKRPFGYIVNTLPGTRARVGARAWAIGPLPKNEAYGYQRTKHTYHNAYGRLPNPHCAFGCRTATKKPPEKPSVRIVT